MRLEMGTFPVHDVVFGATTRYDGGRLTVNRDAVEESLTRERHEVLDRQRRIEHG